MKPPNCRNLKSAKQTQRKTKLKTRMSTSTLSRQYHPLITPPPLPQALRYIRVHTQTLTSREARDNVLKGMLSGNSRALRPLLSQGFVVRSRNGVTWSAPSDRIRLLSPDQLAKNKVLSRQINAACRSLSDPSISLFLALDSDQRSKTTQQMNFDSNK